MSSKSPNYYKQKWRDHYEKLAKAKGVKFTDRQWKRIENGFCQDEWMRDNKKKPGINSMFGWHYTDVIESIVCSPSPLLSLIHKDTFQGSMFYQPVVLGNPVSKPKSGKSHADLWKKRSN